MSAMFVLKLKFDWSVDFQEVQEVESLIEENLNLRGDKGETRVR